MRSRAATGTPAGDKQKIQELDWIHMMEALLKNLSQAVELLAVAAHSGAVRRWDEPALSRAFHWAEYCQHIHCRFRSNPAIRRVVEKQLELTNQSLRDVFPGCSEVSFSDLPRCRDLLLVGLLHNLELPISIMKLLFKCQGPGTASTSDYEDVPGLCSDVVRRRSVCKVLRPLWAPSAVGADAEVQAELLMERLSQERTDLCRAEQFLCSVLQVFQGAEQRLCAVVAAALLLPTDSSEQAASQDFLLDWLQRQRAALHGMCSLLPPTTLQELLRRHRKFRSAFCETLKRWASEMEYRVCDGEWARGGATPTVSFQSLTEHFLLLFETCPSLKRPTEEELNALKIADGDFDVQGLSVWGDVLSALNK